MLPNAAMNDHRCFFEFQRYRFSFISIIAGIAHDQRRPKYTEKRQMRHNLEMIY
jgi:hypothetical protein